jgi:hypothetical protein
MKAIRFCAILLFVLSFSFIFALGDVQAKNWKSKHWQAKDLDNNPKYSQIVISKNGLCAIFPHRNSQAITIMAKKKNPGFMQFVVINGNSRFESCVFGENDPDSGFKRLFFWTDIFHKYYRSFARELPPDIRKRFNGQWGIS